MASNFLHYDIKKKLGEGGMGIVYLARDTRLKRDVALKFLPKRIAKDQSKHGRFRTEAQAAAVLNHRNIAQVYAIEEANGELCIVLEYVEGEELKDVIDDEKITSEEKQEVAAEIAEGIKAAHDKGIIHRDIKSRNIMIDSSKGVKIMDFGLAHLEGSEPSITRDTTAGTTAYMSPEQLRGKEADNRSDIWSYGVVLYEMFTGELPFQGMHEAAIMYSITEEEPLPIDSENSDIPEYIRQVINRCLEKNPDDRYQKISDVLNDLREGNEDSETSAAGEEAGILNKKAYLVIGAAVLTIILSLFLFFRNNEFDLMGNVPQKKYLAVLPIENISDDPNLESISAGLTETLSFRLSDLEQYENEYWVTPASEIRSANVASASQANEIFGVNLAIRSTIQIIQDSTRMILELIDADNIVRMETEQVTVSSRNLAQLEKESVQAMLNMLQIEVQPVMVETISRGEPKNPDAYEFYLKGRASLQEPANLEMLDNAIQHFEDALDIDSDFALAYAGLGEAYWRKFVITQNIELVDQAKYALSEAQSIDENLPAVQFLMGLIENGQNNYEGAIQHFENALNLNPEYTRAHRQMANSYYNLGDNEKALNIYERLIEGQPEYWVGYRDLALYHYDEANWEQAIENFKKAINLTSQNSSLYSNLGAAYFYNSKVDSARMMFERSMAIEENPLSAVNLATIYYRNGNYTEAADMYQLVLEIEVFRNRYEIWANYASAVEWSESKDGEEELYQTAIDKAEEQLDVNPDDAVVLSSIAAFYSDLNNREQALEYLNKAINLESENQVLIVNAISTYENLGMREEALSWVQADIISQIEWLPDLQTMIEDPEYLEMKEELLKQES